MVSVRQEPLSAMLDNLEYGFKETEREGFPVGSGKAWPSEFVAMFCAAEDLEAYIANGYAPTKTATEKPRTARAGFPILEKYGY